MHYSAEEEGRGFERVLLSEITRDSISRILLDKHMQIAELLFREATKSQTCYYPLLSRKRPLVVYWEFADTQQLVLWKIRFATSYFWIHLIWRIHDGYQDNDTENIQCYSRFISHQAESTFTFLRCSSCSKWGGARSTTMFLTSTFFNVFFFIYLILTIVGLFEVEHFRHDLSRIFTAY